MEGEQLLLDTLEKAGLVYKAKLAPQQVGARPQNRDGLGIVSDAVHDLLDCIVEVGYMPQKVDAVAVEIPDGTEGDEIRRFNHKLVCMSSGRLGIMRADKLRAATLCGPHTNFALRIAVDEGQNLNSKDPGTRARASRRYREWFAVARDHQSSCPAFPSIATFDPAVRRRQRGQRRRRAANPQKATQPCHPREKRWPDA